MQSELSDKLACFSVGLKVQCPRGPLSVLGCAWTGLQPSDLLCRTLRLWFSPLSVRWSELQAVRSPGDGGWRRLSAGSGTQPLVSECRGSVMDVWALSVSRMLPAARTGTLTCLAGLKDAETEAERGQPQAGHMDGTGGPGLRCSVTDPAQP